MRELIPIRKLTPREKEILERMKSGEELCYEKGSGWWIGDDRTSGRKAFIFLRFCMVSEDAYSGVVQRYHLNGTGEECLSKNMVMMHPEIKEAISKNNS